MKIDLNQIADPVDRLLPWDLVLTIDGVDYPTVRPTVGLVIELESAKADVSKIFLEGNKPPMTAWSTSVLAAAIATYLTTVGDHVRKNSPALVAAIRSAARAQTLPQPTPSTTGASS